MTISNEIEPTGDPNGTGQDAGSQPDDQGTQPAAETFTREHLDSQLANARRTWQYEESRRLERERANWQRQAQPAPKPDDPWSTFEPTAAQALRAALNVELETALAPYKQEQATFKQQQEDLAFANDESRISTQYKDYGPNRAAILEFGVARGIADLDTAYRAWAYDRLSKIDPEAIGRKAIADHLKKKAAQAAGTPSVEGRGGAPSSQQKFKSREDMDEAAMQIIRDANSS